jgi:copper(I)-binding protein
MYPTRLARLVALLAVVVVAGACSSGSASSIKVTDAWARNSPMVSGAGAAYMTITNSGSEGDTLLSASSPAAKTVEIHETVVMDASPEASTGMGGMESPAASMDAGAGSTGGMMGMQKVDQIAIPANGTVELKPGGYHIMLIDPTTPMEAGQKFDITLTFEKAGAITVSAEVRAQ